MQSRNGILKKNKEVAKKRVLIITTTFLRWENDRLPSFVYDFACGIRKKCDVHVLAPHARNSKTNELINGLKIHRFKYAPERLEFFGSGDAIFSILKNKPLIGLLVPAFIIFAAFAIAKLHFKYKFDIIHLHWLIPFGPVVGILSLFTKFQYIITSHGSDVFPFTNKPGILPFVITWLHRLFTFPRVDHIVAVSKSLKNAMVSTMPIGFQSKISVISMGINYNLFSNKAHRKLLQEPLKIVFVGRLAEVKGVKYLIDAMGILRDKNLDFTLQIYGDGLLRISLEQQVEELALSAFIDFNGFIEHSSLTSCLAESDIFIGPSIVTPLGESEGLGLVLLEAMAAGLMVVGTKTGGIPEIVIDGVTGILIDEKNPNAIANAIVNLYHNKSLQKKLIEGGKIFALQYDWSVISDKYFGIYGISNK